MQGINQFIQAHQLLFTGDHILQIDLGSLHLGLSDNGHIGDLLRIGIAHLLLHLGRLRIEFRTDTGLTDLSNQRQQVGLFLLSEVGKEQLGCLQRISRIKIQLVQHIEDTVSTKRDAHAGHTIQAKHASQVIVATSSGVVPHGV